MGKVFNTVNVIPLISLPLSKNYGFTYKAPLNLSLKKGDLVEIPFGKQTTQGIVVGDSKKEASDDLKSVSKILANGVLTEKELFWLEELAKNSLESFPLILKSVVTVRKENENNLEKNGKKEKNKFEYLLKQSDFDISKIISSSTEGQILVLIPEIIFAQRIVAMCEKFKRKYQVYSHGMGLKKRRIFFDKINSENQNIIISTQSGIFLPFKDLRKIIVYESSLSSHRQWGMRPHYDSRIAAVLKARRYEIPIYFHSSLPFLELSEIGDKKNQEKISLTNSTVAVLKKYPENNTDLLPETINKIKDIITKKKSALIFHDSIGYENMYICGSCGHISTCDICGSILQKNEWALYCRTCSKNVGPIRAFCVKCGSPKVRPRKTGTRAIEDLIKNTFPGLDVIRLDRENSKKEEKQTELPADKPFVVIATQKIFSFFEHPIFNLCVIPDPSTLFRSVNYDSLDIGLTLLKRLDQLLMPQSLILLESFQGSSNTLLNIEKGNIAEIIKNDLLDRKKLLFPPFASILYCEKKFASPDRAEKEVKKIVEKLREDKKAIADWSVIKKNKSIYARILLKSQLKNIESLMAFIPPSWSMDPHISLMDIFAK